MIPDGTVPKRNCAMAQNATAMILLRVVRQATAPASKRLQIAVSAVPPVGHTARVATRETLLVVSVPRRTAVLQTSVKINLL